MQKFKMQKELEKRNEVAELLLRQKTQFTQGPALLSAYPQRDLQKGAIESSLSPHKSKKKQLNIHHREREDSPNNL